MKNAWRSHRSGCALIVLLTVAAYLPVRNDGFVFDDKENVTANQSLRTLEGLKRIWTDPQASFQYYPLTYTSFWVEYHLWGLRPAGYHAANVLLHALNALLVGLLLARLAVPGAWLAALLFALHPVHVESVAWVSEQKNVLSGFFYLTSLLTYLRSGDDTKRRWRFYALSFALFVCALLSKTSAVSMPFAVLLVLWWKRERVKGQDGLALIPFFLAGAALGLVTAWVEVHYSRAQGPEWQWSWLERCLVAGRVVWFYAGKLVWPHPLMIIYPRWQVNTAVWWQYLFPCGTGAVILVLWLCRKQVGKAPLAAILFFAGTLVPIPAFINVAFMRCSYVADHWQYLSSIGLIALAVAAGDKIGRRMGGRGQPVRALASAAVLVALGLATWTQCRVYETNETLWRDTVTKNPGAWLAHYNLGNVLTGARRVTEAIAHYEQALQIKPDYPEAHCNLGNVLLDSGRVTEAVMHYEQALRIKPNYIEVQNNLAWLLATTESADGGDPVRAVALAEQTCRLTDHRVAAYLDTLATAYAAAGRFNEAIATAQKAIELARSAGQPELVREIEARLELYRRGTAYRQTNEVTSPPKP